MKGIVINRKSVGGTCSRESPLALFLRSAVQESPAQDVTPAMKIGGQAVTSLRKLPCASLLLWCVGHRNYRLCADRHLCEARIQVGDCFVVPIISIGTPRNDDSFCGRATAIDRMQALLSFPFASVCWIPKSLAMWVANYRSFINRPSTLSS